MTGTRMTETRMFRIGVLAAAVAWLAAMMAPYASAAQDGASRIVAIGGSVTEIVYALGAQDRLVARDTTSSYPDAATDLPDVGYIRALSPEGVLSVDPDLIISLEGAGPPEAVSVLKQAGVPFVEIPEGYDRAAIVAKIQATGQALGEVARAAELAANVDAQLKTAEEAASAVVRKQRVLFILSTAGGRIMTAGTGTHADGIIALAGGVNAMETLDGYKQVTDEAVAQAAPDVILMMDRGGDHGVINADLLAHPAIALTPAGKAGRIVRMDGLYLLGFGPRTAAAAHDLAAVLYGTGQTARN